MTASKIESLVMQESNHATVVMFRLVFHWQGPRRLSIHSHQLPKSRSLAKKAKTPKPKKPVYHRGIERASLRSEELLAATFQKPFKRSQFDEARSSLNYLRTKPSSNKRSVHGSLDLLDRLVREIHEQEQMYRSNWLDFDYVEPLLQNWVQSWREEHERDQGVYEPMVLLEEMQAIPWPSHFDPHHKVAETILSGMIDVAHKFDAPELGEEMLQKIETVTLDHCNLVLKAWAKSDLWNGADQEGLRAFCHSMVQVHGQVPNRKSLKIMASLLGDDEACKTLESAISGQSDAVAVLANVGLLDRAEGRFMETVANNGPVYECARAILQGHHENVLRAETFFHETREFLNGDDHDLLLELLVDLYAKDGDYEKAEKAMYLARFERPFRGLIAALEDKPGRIVTLVHQNLHDTAVVQAALESLSSNLHVEHAMSVIRLIQENRSDSPARLIDVIVRGITMSSHPECGKLAYQVFHETKELQISLTTEAIHGIVESCLRTAMLREADVVARDFVKFDSLEDAKPLFDCWALLGTRAKARESRKKFDAIDSPGVFAYQVLLYSIVMSANPNTGSELFEVYEHIKQSGHGNDDVCIELLMTFCVQSEEIEDLERAQALFDFIETENRKKSHYELLATGWLRMNEPKRAREVFFRQVEDYNNRADGKTIRPSQEIVSAITKKFLKQKRLLKAHHFVEDITDLWLAKYLPEPPHKVKTIRPLLDAWGMSSYHGKDVYIEDVLNDFAGFDDESQTQPYNHDPFQAPGDVPGDSDDEPKLFYEMDDLSDDEDKAMFPDAIDDIYPLGDVHLESDSEEEEEEQREPDWVIRKRGYYGNMPDNAFDDSSDDDDDDDDIGCDEESNCEHGHDEAVTE